MRPGFGGAALGQSLIQTAESHIGLLVSLDHDSLLREKCISPKLDR